MLKEGIKLMIILFFFVNCSIKSIFFNWRPLPKVWRKQNKNSIHIKKRPWQCSGNLLLCQNEYQYSSRRLVSGRISNSRLFLFLHRSIGLQNSDESSFSIVLTFKMYGGANTRSATFLNFLCLKVFWVGNITFSKFSLHLTQSAYPSFKKMKYRKIARTWEWNKLRKLASTSLEQIDTRR